MGALYSCRPSTEETLLLVEGVSKQWIPKFGLFMLAKIKEFTENHPRLGLDSFPEETDCGQERVGKVQDNHSFFHFKFNFDCYKQQLFSLPECVCGVNNESDCSHWQQDFCMSVFCCIACKSIVVCCFVCRWHLRREIGLLIR